MYRIHYAREDDHNGDAFAFASQTLIHFRTVCAYSHSLNRAPAGVYAPSRVDNNTAREHHPALHTLFFWPVWDISQRDFGGATVAVRA